MIGIVYNSTNKLKMENEFSSIKFQMIGKENEIELVHYKKDLSKYKVLVSDGIIDKDKKAVLIVSSINQIININKNVILIQYESGTIKNHIEEKYPELFNVYNIIINCIPKQKLEINPLDSQNSTIFFQGEDKPENMVNEMFELDNNTKYEILFYDNETKEIPSTKHKLSWNVTIDNNLKDIISYKIIKEIENGCLPILLKENMPKCFFTYPFCISIKELNDKKLLIQRVKNISSFIGKMSKDDFKVLANSIYNSIYIYSNWKLNFFKISEEINRHLKNNTV